MLFTMAVQHTQTEGGAEIKYYISGKTPEILILSGTHGDECDILPFVESSIKKHQKKLPPFLFIPEVSPSAIKLKTRVNSENLDINRHFCDETQSKEARAIMNIVEHFTFQACFSFHEDVSKDCFYFYDTENLHGTFYLRELKRQIENLNLKLLNGADDPLDPILGHEFVDGYKWLIPEKDLNKCGMFCSWAFEKGIIKRMCTPEIPGQAHSDIKEKTIAVFFETMIIGPAKHDGIIAR